MKVIARKAYVAIPRGRILMSSRSHIRGILLVNTFVPVPVPVP